MMDICLIRQLFIILGLLKNLIYNAKDKTNLLSEFEDLIDKGYREHVNIDLNMDLKTLTAVPNTVWILFMLTGYLTPTTLVGNGENINLKIPNLEIRKNLIKMSTSWFLDDYKGNKIVKLLINREIDEFKNNLEKIVLTSFSFMDVPGNSESEAFYHSFVLGLLTSENDFYEVTSNRES